jgi:hypothetical protein
LVRASPAGAGCPSYYDFDIDFDFYLLILKILILKILILKIFILLTGITTSYQYNPAV